MGKPFGSRAGMDERNSLQRLAALEMVTVLFEDEQRRSLYETVRPCIEAIAEPAAKERELIAKLAAGMTIPRRAGSGYSALQKRRRG